MKRVHETDLFGILRALTRHRVEFVVVGGVSAVLQGAPVITFDLDVVHARGEANVARLLAALDELDAVYRTQPERQLKPNASHLSSQDHQLLLTLYGPLDLLGAIGQSRTYEDLLGDSVAMEIEPGLVVRVLKLDRLIAVKKEAPRDKDAAVLPILEQTLKERDA